MTRKFPWVEPLAAGTYCATCREQTAEAAERNGHGAVYPSARCHSDGKWVAFWRDGDEVWGCNATYAAAHFTFTPWSPAA